MRIWAGIKFAINDTLGTSSFKPLNKLISDMSTTIKNLVTSETTGVETHVTTQATGIKTAITTNETNVKSHVTTQANSVKTAVTSSELKIHSHLQELSYHPVRVITATGTFKPEKTGTYKVICVGAGGDGNIASGTGGYLCGGGGGGVAIKTLRLLSTTSYNVTVSTTASFATSDSILSATAGGKGNGTDSDEIGEGGTASGGDYNFTGEDGSAVSHRVGVASTGGSVGVTIAGLSRSYHFTSPDGIPHEDGDCILKYGGGGTASQISQGSQLRYNGHPAAVIIIPLELEG